MNEILNLFSSFVKPEELLEQLSSTKEMGLAGLSGSARACALSLILEQCRKKKLRSVIVTSTLDSAEDTVGDLETFGFPHAEIFIPWDTDIDGVYIPDRSIISSKISLLTSMQNGFFNPVVIPAAALMQPLPDPAEIERSVLVIHTGDSITRSDLIGKLVDCGLERTEMVDNYGQFAVRGGIVDVYPFGSPVPYRIEFFGDTIESLRTFSVRDQTSSTETGSCEISRISASAVTREIQETDGSSLDEYCRSIGLCMMIETPEILKAAGETEAALSGGPTSFFPFQEVLERMSCSMKLHVTGLPFGELPEHTMPASVPVADEFTSASSPVKKIAAMSHEHRLFIACQNSAEEHRVSELLERETHKKRSNIHLFTGNVSSGFIIPSRHLVLTTTREIFQRYKIRRPLRPISDPALFRPIEGFTSLSKGDYVVHLLNGIGKFQGLTVIEKGGIEQEYVTLEYADSVTLHVPVTRINLLQKYIGGTKEKPNLDRLGGQKWKKRRNRAAQSVENIAEDLLETQAERFRTKGIQYPPDTDWQHEFEASFMYEDTLDQTEALKAIKKDMESPAPMDRLLCGDVGFGKTELAVRASFKTALAGMQIAVLVPTTILAQQHYITFKERMADYPVTIDYLSRFKSPSEQKRSVLSLKQGNTDIIIGTHRLLSNDIGFKNLGLLIIDEEQRFGVGHKERLKRFRKTVDLLTLTATPIPRTLHMSLLGIKDISSLQTPPEERKPIFTKVTAFSDRVIRRAVQYELSRNGQVFFVHNRVYNIDYYVHFIQGLIPEARVGKVHGRMDEKEIEHNMKLFLRNEFDVLVCTTIIESGIDLPNVNTLIVNNAQSFGLADLHQLRGRVGRFTRQAYAYLLIPSVEPISGEAAKRLKTIEHYSELGSGFRIALQDLEIRGAGNILGPEQSGHIAAIGYDLYCRILDTVIRRKRGEEVRDPFDKGPEIDLPVSAFIPSSYIKDFRIKLEMYRKIEQTDSPDAADHVQTELKDRFGPCPPEVTRLLMLQKTAVYAKQQNAERIFLRENHLNIAYRKPGGSRTAVIPAEVRNDQDALCAWVLKTLEE